MLLSKYRKWLIEDFDVKNSNKNILLFMTSILMLSIPLLLVDTAICKLTGHRVPVAEYYGYKDIRLYCSYCSWPMKKDTKKAKAAIAIFKLKNSKGI